MFHPLARIAVIGGVLLSTAIPLAAQQPRAPAAPAVPVAPPETCRIWYRSLPAEQQPRPMDCRTARRQAAITGGEVLVGNAEPGGAFHFSQWDERYRRETERRLERDEARIRAERDRDWRDGTWDDRDWRDDLDPWR